MRRTLPLLLFLLLAATPGAAAQEEKATLEGTLRLPDGTFPRAGAVVAIWHAPPGHGASWLANATPEGRFRLALAPGNYTLVALDNDTDPWTLSAPHVARCPQDCLTLAAGETRALDLTLRPAGRVVGALRDEEGAPIAGGQVWLREPGQDLNVTAWNDTDAEGRFSLLAPEGAYELLAERFPDGARPLLPARACVEGVACVRPVVNATLTVDLVAPTGVVVEGRMDAPTYPVTGFRVELRDALGATHAAPTRDGHGLRLLVPPGEYAVRLVTNEGVFREGWTLPCCLRVAPPGPVALDLWLDAGGSLHQGPRPPPAHEPAPAPPSRAEAPAPWGLALAALAGAACMARRGSG